MDRVAASDGQARALDAASDTAPPPCGGWTVVTAGGLFTSLVGPVYRSLEDLGPEEPARFGFRVREVHCNPRRVCHGGMLATFLDIALACGMRQLPHVTGPLPTISLTVNYLAAAPCGDWIESRVRLPRIGKDIGFAEATLLGPSGPVLFGSGVYKRFRPSKAATPGRPAEPAG